MTHLLKAHNAIHIIFVCFIVVLVADISLYHAFGTDDALDDRGTEDEIADFAELCGQVPPLTGVPGRRRLGDS